MDALVPTAKRAAERQLVEQAPAVAFARKVELSPLDIPVGAFAKSIGWGPTPPRFAGGEGFCFVRLTRCRAPFKMDVP